MLKYRTLIGIFYKKYSIQTEAIYFVVAAVMHNLEMYKSNSWMVSDFSGLRILSFSSLLGNFFPDLIVVNMCILIDKDTHSLKNDLSMINVITFKGEGNC
jgi:hypothetical protein